MRFAIIAHNLRVGGGLVVGRNICAVLPRLAPEVDMLMVVPRGLGYEATGGHPRVRVVSVDAASPARRMWFDGRELRRVLADFAPDLVWALGNVPVPGVDARQALLLHDPHLLYPARHYALETARNRLQKAVLRRHLARSLRSLETVFCQTESARRRFRERFSFAGRVELCPVAISAFAVASGDPAPPPLLAAHPDRFKLLFVTRYYAHKNIERLIETYARHRSELRDTLCVLTIEAGQHPRAAGVLADIQRRGLADSIMSVGALRPDQLPAHYLACDAVIQPSLLESFSSAYLEAMRFGRPILASDLDFAREVCGDAALYFDPWRTESIMEAIVRLRDDAALRAELRCKGSARQSSGAPTWTTIVARALDVLGVPRVELDGMHGALAAPATDDGAWGTAEEFVSRERRIAAR